MIGEEVQSEADIHVDSTEMGETNTNCAHLLDNDCSVIHLAFVAAGYGTSKSVVTVLKSILFYRRSPLHLHLIVDRPARVILQTLLPTWQLPLFNYSFYSTESLEQMVKWIPNAHYSGVYGLMKLVLPSILPLSVESIIVLDTDITVITDIKFLWNYLRLMRQEGKVIGLVENQSNWYLGTLWADHKPWPALGRGFNTGVMLMDLKMMREAHWNDQWNMVAKSVLVEYQYTSLADQDIVNALIKDHPDCVYALPCSWNIQLSDNTLSEDCYMQIDQYKIIHWNSPKKVEVANKHAAHFRDIYYTFVQYDGNLLRHGLLHCEDKNRSSSLDTLDPSLSKEEDSMCIQIESEASFVYRTHLYYYGQLYTASSDNDVTLVAQFSFDRLPILESIFEHWKGPMSMAGYVTDSEALQLSPYFKNVKGFQKRKNIAIHLVYKYGRLYPINHLRNIALANVGTPYVFLSDIDFVPMFDLYEYLKASVTALEPGRHKRALVVPAFEAPDYKFFYPHSKETLLQMLLGGTIKIFRHDLWKQGHAPTDYKKWKGASKPYKVKWAPDFEPYVIVQKNVTKYDERFMGFGWNKVSHIMELGAQGYEFVVLPNAFMIHSPHTPSLDITKYRTSKQYRDCLGDLKQRFTKELVQKYGTSALKYAKSLENQKVHTN